MKKCKIWLLLYFVLSLSELHAGVFISEFMADNGGSLLTAEGLASDWIELFNDSETAVDLGGWGLSDREGNPLLWCFPQGSLIPAKGYLLVFADSSPLSLVGGELHASFSLSRSGEYLSLARPDGTLVQEFAPAFPPQFTDVSYGLGRESLPVITPSDSYSYCFPDRPGEGGTGIGGIGSFSVAAGFTCTQYDINRPVKSIDIATQSVADPSTWRSEPVTKIFRTLSFADKAAPDGSFPVTPFPGNATLETGKDNFVVVCRGILEFPSAGVWSFSVSSDDGYRLTLSGHGVVLGNEFPSPRGPTRDIFPLSIPSPGAYELELVYFEQGGGALCDLAVAKGSVPTFSTEHYSLVGSERSGLYHAGAFGAFVDTDVRSSMIGLSPQLKVEWCFNWERPVQAGDILTLTLRYGDGVDIRLNGERACPPLNTPPDPLTSESLAPLKRSSQEIYEPVRYPIPASLLRQGENRFTILGLNNAVDDPDFLIDATLDYSPARRFPVYFKLPTPGETNAGRHYTPPTPIVVVSEPRGYKSQPFSVTLSAPEAPLSDIYYTLDGREPHPDSAILYTQPFTVDKTTVLRASVPDPRSIRQSVTTVSWLFPEDIVRQSQTPPSLFPVGKVNGQRMVYGMDGSIVERDGERLLRGMTGEIPSISLVFDPADLFNPQTGIYVNPRNRGRLWEREVSVEQIDPVRGSTNEFHIDAGIRIRGAASRNPDNPKHSFRLFFRSDYGEGKLRFPLFGEEGASEFDRLDLRTSQNHSWSWNKSDRETFVREVFSRDCQRDMGEPYTRSRFVHLYLNGLYWGLYQTQERGDENYASTYFGGDKEEWDVIKTTSDGGYQTTAANGSFEAFLHLQDLTVNQGYAGNYAGNYMRVLGRGEGGEIDPTLPVYLDPTNLMVYMMVTHLTGDSDSPVSQWGKLVNNMYGLRNRITGDRGFFWLKHDAEHSLGAHDGVEGPLGINFNNLLLGTERHDRRFLEAMNFNPSLLHQRLCQNPEYRMAFADQVQAAFFDQGPLSAESSRTRFRKRMEEIDCSVVCESARWGNGHTRDDHWIPECTRVLDLFFPRRVPVLLGQYRAQGWFPGIDAPVASTNRALVSFGTEVSLSSSDSLYYTLDGSDPRLSGGGVNPSALSVAADSAGPVLPLLSKKSRWSCYDLGQEPPADSLGRSWRDPGHVPADGWREGNGILGFTGSGHTNPIGTPLNRYAPGGEQVSTYYFRQTVTLDRGFDSVGELEQLLLLDDGYILYLNGVEIDRKNMDGRQGLYGEYASRTVGGTDQTTYFQKHLPLPAGLLRSGPNLFAVEVHQCNNRSTDLYFDMELKIPETFRPSCVASIPVKGPTRILARALREGEWSALTEVRLSVPMDFSALKVTELMYAPSLPQGVLCTEDDCSWMELRNCGAVPLNLANVAFTDGISHLFAPLVLAPGERMVLAKNPDIFTQLYGPGDVQVVGWGSGNLKGKGETLTVVDPEGKTVLSFNYSNKWYPESYRTGRSLVAVDPFAEAAQWSTAQNWRPGRNLLGTPGYPDTPCLAGPLSIDRNRGVLRFSVEYLEGEPTLWVSDDLKRWQKCPISIWRLDGKALEILINHPDIPPGLSGDRLFFKISVK